MDTGTRSRSELFSGTSLAALGHNGGPPLDPARAPTRRLRTPAAADYIGSTVSTMTKWRMTGAGPPYSKIGKVCVYDSSDLDLFIASRRRHSTSEPCQQRPAPVQQSPPPPAPAPPRRRR
jgi:hypothetical protein